jgi:hypothetical protein
LLRLKSGDLDGNSRKAINDSIKISYGKAIQWYLAIWVVAFSGIQQLYVSSAPVNSFQNAAKINGMQGQEFIEP